MKKKRLELNNGGCAGRWSCKNVNTEKCNPEPKKGEDFIECENYEEQEAI